MQQKKNSDLCVYKIWFSGSGALSQVDWLDGNLYKYPSKHQSLLIDTSMTGKKRSTIFAQIFASYAATNYASSQTADKSLLYFCAEYRGHGAGGIMWPFNNANVLFLLQALFSLYLTRHKESETRLNEVVFINVRS